jgi:hypothetical protein
VLDRRNHLSIGIAILMDGAMQDQLITSLWMLSFRQPGKFFCSHGSRQSEPFCQSAVPFPLDGVALLPVVLRGVSELLRVVGLCLAGREWLRDIQH